MTRFQTDDWTTNVKLTIEMKTAICISHADLVDYDFTYVYSRKFEKRRNDYAA